MGIALEYINKLAYAISCYRALNIQAKTNTDSPSLETQTFDSFSDESSARSMDSCLASIYVFFFCFYFFFLFFPQYREHKFLISLSVCGFTFSFSRIRFIYFNMFFTLMSVFRLLRFVSSIKISNLRI